jgi:O-antigen/teichoic acid export membrane protein
LRLIKKIITKELFKVTSLNSISVFIKILIGFVSSKIIALFIGPSGMAIVGNFRNFITSIESISILGLQNGIVKYVAEFEQQHYKLKKMLSTIMFCLLIATVIVSVFLIVFSEALNRWVFGVSNEYQSIFKIVAFCLPWYIVSLFLTAVLNGFGAYKKVIYISIIGNTIGLVLTFVLITNFKTFGALIALIVAPTLVFFTSLYYFNGKYKLISFSKEYIDFSIIKNLSEYSLMALISAVIGPLIYLLIRNYIINTIGVNEAGYWEGLSRIASYYYIFLSSIITLYYLPKLAKSTSATASKVIVWSYYKNILPLFVVGLVFLFLLKDFLIPMLFTKEFLPITTLMFWQLLGDIFKAISLILGYQFFAKKLTKAFIISEIFSLSILYFSSIFLLNHFGIKGAVMAHCFTYFIYCIVLFIYFRKIVFKKIIKN